MGVKATWDRALEKVVPPKTAEDDEQKESYFIPGALVTTLFFLWGFSYGLLDTLNKHFQNVLGISKFLINSVQFFFRLGLTTRTFFCSATTQTTYMQVAYFGAYFVISPM